MVTSDFRGPAVVSREVGETCRLCRNRLKIGENIIIFDHGGPWPVHTSCWDPRSPHMHEEPTGNVSVEEAETIDREVNTLWDVFRVTWKLYKARRAARRV